MELLSLLCLHPESSYLIRVVGDSMIDAGILPGDVVIVDKSNRNPTPKEIAVCELNGEYTLKHFVEENGRGLRSLATGVPVAEAVRKVEASLWILGAKRTMATVLPAWGQWKVGGLRKRSGTQTTEYCFLH